MSPTPDTPDTQAGEVRTYRGRTIEELVPRIRQELGPGAIILRERQGVTGGIGGFFAKRCVEIDAQAAPRLNVYADDDADDDETGDVSTTPAASVAAEPSPSPTPAPAPTTPDPFAALAPADSLAPDPFAGFAARLAEAQATPESVPTAPVAPETPAQAAAPAAPAAPAVPEAPAESPAFIAFDEVSPSTPDREADEIATVDATVVEDAEIVEADEDGNDDRDEELSAETPAEIAIPIVLEVAEPVLSSVSSSRTEPIGSASVFRAAADLGTSAEPAAAPIAAVPAIPATFAALTTPATGDVDLAETLTERLAARGLARELATELVAIGRVRSDAGTEPGLAAATQAVLAEILPAAPPLPLPTGVIAVVGSGGSGKTRAACGLALALARRGHRVTVARLDGVEHGPGPVSLLHHENIELIPSMRTQATVRAVAAARTRRLVIIDTAAAGPGDHAALEVLVETLAPFTVDSVMLCAPATFTADVLTRLAAGYAPLPIRGLIATHADEAGELGTIAELSIRSGLPAGYIHSGLDLATAVTALDPARLAGHLLR